MSRFNDRKAFVTSGAKGIRAAIARRLAAEGVDVVIGDIDIAAAQQLATEIKCKAVLLDVANGDQVSEVISAAGPFAILVNNAGVDQHSYFTKTKPADWRKLIAINLEAVFATTLAVLPAMQENRFGRIVNISSEAGRLGSNGGSIYAAAKAGVIGFTKSIARENARFGITANVVAPGPISTPLLQQAVDRGGDKLLKAMESATQIGRLGTVEEVAAAVAYLASDEASYTTGETLGVSGGMGMG